MGRKSGLDWEKDLDVRNGIHKVYESPNVVKITGRTSTQRLEYNSRNM